MFSRMNVLQKSRKIFFVFCIGVQLLSRMFRFVFFPVPYLKFIFGVFPLCRWDRFFRTLSGIPALVYCILPSKGTSTRLPVVLSAMEITFFLRKSRNPGNISYL